MAVAPALVQGGLGLLKTVDSLIQGDKAKEIAAQLEKSRPKLGRDALADENLAFAKSELANGMSASAEKAYNDIADRDFSASLSTLLKGGGDLNSIGDIYGAKEEGRQRLALMKDQLRLNQINQKVAASKAVSERNDQMFQFNEWMPWADKAQANAQARQGAVNGVWQGLNTIGSAAMGYAQGRNESNQFGLNEHYDNILGTGNKSASSGGGGINSGGAYYDPLEQVW